jgi:hypothetical protein
MNYGSGLWVNLGSEMYVANLYSTAQQRDATERQQCGAAADETCRTLWPFGTQSNLRVEKLNVGVVEWVLLQLHDIARVLAQ